MSGSGTVGPTQFGKYLLDGELAQGGMARVFNARLRGPGGFEKRLVVKQILPRLARDPAFVDLFVREANTLVQMSHPHIVPVYELGIVDGVYFLALEWVEGLTLSQIVRQAGDRLQPGMIAHVGAQVCEALHYAFTRFSVVHRDVTPRNIMIDEGGHARLLDFGIAAPVADTGGGARFGSPGYMAPEQLRGEGLGARSDLFSLGASLYEGLAGRPAFPDRERARRVDTLDAPAPLPDSVDPALSTLVMSMLAFDPDDRPRDAAAAAVALRGIAARRHPEGVAHGLGELVATLRRGQHETPDSAGVSRAVLATDGGGTEVKSLATNVELRRIMEQPTEALTPTARQPIEAPSPEAPAAPADAPAAPTVTLPIARPAPAQREATTGPGTERIPLSAPPPAPTSPEPPRPSVDARPDLRRYVWPLLALATAGLMLWLQPPAAVPGGRDADRSIATDADRVRDSPPSTRDADRSMAPGAHTAITDAGRGTTAGAANAGAADAGAAQDRPQANTPQTARGYLTVGALPWGEVLIDGRNAGTTPLRRRMLSPGSHLVVVTCPPLGRQAETRVEIAAGTRTHLQVDLNRDPPLITTR